MKVNIEIKIKMENGKDVVLNHEEAKELLFKLKEVFPDPVYFPQPITPIIYEPFKWWQQPWYSGNGNINISYSTGE